MENGECRNTLEKLNMNYNPVIDLGRIIYKGAEATLYKGKWFDKEVLVKHRIPKKYRIEELDKKLRRTRTILEAKMLISIKKCNVPVPQVFEVDHNNNWLIIKYIKGQKFKDLIGKIDKSKRKWYFEQIGRYIAFMHKNDFIHGDLTTSNIIITKNEKIFFVDFGLSMKSIKIEDKSVDLHLIKRVLLSTHGQYFEECFESLINGYKLEYGNKSDEIIDRIETVESRGRYIEKNKRKN